MVTTETSIIKCCNSCAEVWNMHFFTLLWYQIRYWSVFTKFTWGVNQQWRVRLRVPRNSKHSTGWFFWWTLKFSIRDLSANLTIFFWHPWYHHRLLTEIHIYSYLFSENIFSYLTQVKVNPSFSEDIMCSKKIKIKKFILHINWTKINF